MGSIIIKFLQFQNAKYTVSVCVFVLWCILIKFLQFQNAEHTVSVCVCVVWSIIMVLKTV
jgi:hypothetical protein